MAPASGRAVVQRVPGLLAVDLGVLVSTSSFLEALTTSGVCRRGARLAAGSRAWKRPAALAKARELTAEAITVVAIAMMTHEAS
jgi:hypothetical protein